MPPIGCGGRIRTNDLRIMSPTSYLLLHPAMSALFLTANGIIAKHMRIVNRKINIFLLFRADHLNYAQSKETFLESFFQKGVVFFLQRDRIQKIIAIGLQPLRVSKTENVCFCDVSLMSKLFFGFPFTGVKPHGTTVDPP